MDPKNIKNTKNPRNPDSTLYRRLTKLFSGPLINYRSQNTRQLRRRRLDKYAKTFKDVAGQKFERLGYNRDYKDMQTLIRWNTLQKLLLH